jgi:hypothetical protein
VTIHGVDALVVWCLGGASIVALLLSGDVHTIEKIIVGPPQNQTPDWL